MRGGIAIGAAAAIKVMPVLFIPYLAWRGRWRAALAAALAMAGFSLSPILVFGWRRFWSDVASWLRIIQISWDVSGPNQSIYAMWDRIIGHHFVPFVAPGAIPLLPSGQPAVIIAWALTFALLGLVLLFAFRGPRCTSMFCWALEWSAIFLIAAIFGRITWKHYLIVMLLPNLLLYALWRSPAVGKRVRTVSGSVLLICFALALVTGSGLVGRGMALRFETASVATVAVLLMLAALFWLRRRPDVLNIAPVRSSQPFPME